VRIDSLEEFNYLQERIDWMREREEMKSVSLNLETRRAMKQQDEQFRDAMKSRRAELARLNYLQRPVLLDSVVSAGGAAEPTIEELTDEAGDEEGLAEFDVRLRETLRLLRDTIEIAPDPRAWSDKNAAYVLLSHRPEPTLTQKN
jgi:carboxyl-terminal processing protease